MFFFFKGIIDIINLKKLVYNSKSNQVDYAALSEANDGRVWEETLKNRATLVDKLTEYNDTLANQVIASESLDAVPAEHIVSAVKTATCSHVSYFCFKKMFCNFYLCRIFFNYLKNR